MKKIILVLFFFFLLSPTQAQSIKKKLTKYFNNNPPEPISLTWENEEDFYLDSMPPNNQDFKSVAFIEKLIESSWIQEDSVVYEVFTRNFQDWNNNLIVMDWTGSMYPYGLQVLIWLEKNKTYQEEVNGVILFNDGDGRENAEKVIGRTGGIYFSSLINVSKAMAMVAQNGMGGDLPENDLEAILGGMKKCPDCENLILIADSQSMVRDLELILKFQQKFPEVKVRVILCGVKQNDDFVIDYLNIATFTQGSVHTIEQDLEDLHLLKKSNVLKIENKNYRLKNGAWQVWSNKRK